MNETICNVMLFGGIALAVIFAIAAVVLFLKLDIPKVVGDLTGSTAKKRIKEIREQGYESVQGSGVSKKDAIKAKDSTGKIEVRDINANLSHSQQLSRQGQERYRKAVNEAAHPDAMRPAQSMGRQTNPADEEFPYETETDVLNEDVAYEEATDVLHETDSYEEATDVLHETEAYEEATDILHTASDNEEATDVLTSDLDDEEATDVLKADAGDEEATDVLKTDVDDEEATDVLKADANDEETTNVLTTGRSQMHMLPDGFVMTTNIVITHTEENL